MIENLLGFLYITFIRIDFQKNKEVLKLNKTNP